MFRHVPNALTTLRLVLAAGFFAMLSWYQYEGRGDPTLLNVAFLVYVVALVTDFLDGHLARKWQVEGPFGRVLDPFVDKVLVLGSFIFFAGKNFIIPDDAVEPARGMVVKTITGVTPVMVIILLARELLVTSLRGMAESAGQNFGAAFSGKLKMVAQSVTILVILAYVNYRGWLLHAQWDTPARWARDVFIYATLLITIWSGLLYVRRGIALYRSSMKTAEPSPPPPPQKPVTMTPTAATAATGVGTLKGQRA
jgi:CDP-diacylglycerol--glycerol-3-phosphate 3-phosphatidyltransferase